MIYFEWKSFLKDFIRVLNVEDDDVDFYEKARQLLSSNILETSEEDILAAESRLGITLPPSYRSFLKVSNGWPEMGAAEPGKLWSSNHIQWLRDQDPKMIEIWANSESDISPEEHLYYRDDDNGCFYREAYLQNTLAISDYGDACILLLSPEVVDKNGEWECWKLASWIPGATRHRSFEKWMRSSYEFHIDLINEENEFQWHSTIPKQDIKE